MNHFYNSSSSHQSVFMIFVFFALILCLCNCFGLLYRKKSNHLRLLNTGIFAVLFMLESVFGQAFRKTRLNEAYDEILKLPMWSLWCVAVASSILLAWETAILIRGNKKELHRDSVKQAMDTLHNAICYFTSDGAVKLCNLQMYRLFHSLAQSDLQSLEDLHQALDGCDRQSGIIRLSDELQTYLFPDGKAWRYSETEVRASDGNSFIEAIFTDVTELYEDSLKLKEQTKHLEQISRDLKLLSYNVQTVAKEQEILSAKTTLHDQMGAGVLAVRRILQSGKTAEATYAMELFQKAVHVIKNDNEFAGDKNEFDEFMHDADTIGVKVNLTGTLPKNEELIHAFILAMRECLTNCVRHANATEIYITMVQNESTATLQITNNGLVPQNPITAKGGLKNLEHYISKLQGTMEIQWSPTFMLTIAMPLTKEET